MVEPIDPLQPYAPTRQAFRDAVTRAGGSCAAVVHPRRGPDGEELATDVARFGAPIGRAERVVVVSSGLHGAEGHAGSGVQRQLLASGRLGSLPSGQAVVLVHAVNPYGMAWSRRVDHENVDVNRNFVDTDSPPANPDYAQVDEHLNPVADVLDPDDRSYLGPLAELMALWGPDRTLRVVNGGQYDRPRGVAFGGRRPSWSRRMWESLWDEHLAGADDVVVLDVHTGLGDPGELSVYLTADAEEPAAAAASSWFGDLLRRTDRDDPDPEETGLLGVGLHRWAEAASAVTGRPVSASCCVLEFGTLDPIRGLTCFRADNWLHHHGDPRSDLGRRISQMLLEQFFLPDRDWRLAVADGAAEAIHTVIDAPG